MTKYIESKSGAKFRIQISVGEEFNPEYGLRTDLVIDGRKARKLIIGPSRLRESNGQYDCYYKHEYRGSKRYCRDFEFGDVEVVENPNEQIPSYLRGNVGAFGKISVILYEIYNVRLQPIASRQRDSSRRNRVERMSGKAMKGDTRSHSFTLGERKVAEPKTTDSLYDYVDGHQTPFTKYHFKYRSKAALRSLYIIPKSPSPVSLEERLEEDMSPDKLRELIRQLKSKQAPTVTVKREPGLDGTQTSNKRRERRSRIGPTVIETIDLTGDD